MNDNKDTSTGGTNTYTWLSIDPINNWLPGEYREYEPYEPHQRPGDGTWIGMST